MITSVTGEDDLLGSCGLKRTSCPLRRFDVDEGHSHLSPVPYLRVFMIESLNDPDAGQSSVDRCTFRETPVRLFKLCQFEIW